MALGFFAVGQLLRKKKPNQVQHFFLTDNCPTAKNPRTDACIATAASLLFSEFGAATAVAVARCLHEREVTVTYGT